MYFSVIIPNYNYAHLLPRAVRSVFNQRNAEFEVIVIDDGSIDDSRSVLKELQHEFPSQLSVEFRQNSGAGAARNFGARVSAGEYLVFLDADDELLPGALQRFSEVADQSGAKVIIASSITLLPNGGIKKSPPPLVRSAPHERFEDYLSKRLRLANGAMALHRDVFDDIKFSETLKQAEDMPLFAHAISLFCCGEVDDAAVCVHKHVNSRRHDPAGARDVGMKLVDEIFDEKILPSELMKYRRVFKARRCLSIFRTLLKSGNRAEARTWYVAAIKEDARSVFRMDYTLKYLLSYIPTLKEH